MFYRLLRRYFLLSAIFLCPLKAAFAEATSEEKGFWARIAQNPLAADAWAAYADFLKERDTPRHDMVWYEQVFRTGDAFLLGTLFDRTDLFGNRFDLDRDAYSPHYLDFMLYRFSMPRSVAMEWQAEVQQAAGQAGQLSNNSAGHRLIIPGMPTYLFIREAEAFIREADRYAERFPGLQTLEFHASVSQTDVARILALPCMRHISTLYVRPNQIGTTAFDGARLENLRVLVLGSHNDNLSEIESLLNAEHLPLLSALTLDHIQSLPELEAILNRATVERDLYLKIKSVSDTSLWFTKYLKSQKIKFRGLFIEDSLGLSAYQTTFAGDIWSNLNYLSVEGLLVDKPSRDRLSTLPLIGLRVDKLRHLLGSLTRGSTRLTLLGLEVTDADEDELVDLLQADLKLRALAIPTFSESSDQVADAFAHSDWAHGLHSFIFNFRPGLFVHSLIRVTQGACRFGINSQTHHVFRNNFGEI